MRVRISMMLLLSCLTLQSSIADSGATLPFIIRDDCTAYQDALNSCLAYSTELDHQNEQLKQMLVEARKQTDEATAAYGDAVGKQSVLPFWTWILIGGAVGAVGSRLVK